MKKKNKKLDKTPTADTDTDVSRETPSSNTSSDTEPRRTRAFALQCYDDRDDIISFLNNSPWVHHWALCRHDKDVWTKADEKADPEHKEGEFKKVHTHVLLYTYEAKTLTAIRKIFGRFSKEINPENPQNTLCQEMHDTVKMWRYLRHLDNPEKYQYSSKDVFADDKEYWTKYERTHGMNDNVGYSMYVDKLNGVSTRDMILRYGKDYIYHVSHLKQVVSDTYEEGTRHCRLSYDSYIDQHMLLNTANILRNQLNFNDYPDGFLDMFEKALLQALNNASLLDEYFVYVSKAEN